MKHPKHRIGDVLRWHPDARREVYNCVTDAVMSNLPEWISCLVSEIQNVGSMTWGGAALRSDCDFNIALKKDVGWLDYAHARRWFYSCDRLPIDRALMDYESRWGLHLCLGIMDVEADAYNVFVSVPKMLLFHRTTSFLDDFTVGKVGMNCNVIDSNPIDLNTFDPKTTPVPPALDLHLRWDGYLLRWRKESARKAWKTNTKFSPEMEKWADEVPEWKAYYGEHFQGYERVTIDRNGQISEELVPV